MFGKGTPLPLLESGIIHLQKVTFWEIPRGFSRLQGIEPLKNVPIHLVKGRLTKGHRFGKKKLEAGTNCGLWYAWVKSKKYKKSYNKKKNMGDAFN